MKTTVLINRSRNRRILEVELTEALNSHLDRGGLVTITFNGNGEIAWVKEAHIHEKKLSGPQDDSG